MGNAGVTPRINLGARWRYDVCRSGGIDPRILNLGNRWRGVVSFTPWPLYPRGKRPRYPVDRRLGAPQNRAGRGGEEKISQHCQCREFNPGRPVRSLVSIVTVCSDWSDVCWNRKFPNVARILRECIVRPYKKSSLIRILRRKGAQ
jgi:hypothetical protein